VRRFAKVGAGWGEFELEVLGEVDAFALDLDLLFVLFPEGEYLVVG
jgi:hypothetical protein